MSGEPFASVGKFSLHPSEHIIHARRQATTTTEELLRKLEDISELGAKQTNHTQNIVYIFKGDFDLEYAYTIISETFAKVQCVFCVGLNEGGLVVYINKKGFKFLPVDVGINSRDGVHQKPLSYRFNKASRGKLLEQSVQEVATSMTRLMRNFKIVAPTSGDYSFDQLLDIIKATDMDKILRINGQTTAVFWKNRTEFQKIFLRCYKTLMEVRERENRRNGICFNAYKPTMDIIPANMMVNLDQKGTRLKEVDLTLETYSLKDLFDRPLAMKHGIVILGPPETTGFGKTQLALRLAVEFAKAYNKVKHLPKEDAVVVFSNTIDVAKDIKFKPGYVWVLDEMNPADPTQAIHMGENMMKVLLAPTVPGSVRCRNEDMQLPAGVLRIFTGNAASAQEWCGHRAKWTEPLQRKSVVYVLGKPIVPKAWRTAEAHEENEGETAEVMMAVRESVGNLSEEAATEPSLLGGLMNAMFGSRA